MRTGNSLFKFTANGLLQSLNGSTTFYRVNSLIYALKATMTSAKGVNQTYAFNPYALSVTTTRSSEGKIAVTINTNNGAVLTKCIVRAESRNDNGDGFSTYYSFAKV